MDIEQGMFFKEIYYNIIGIAWYIGKSLSESSCWCI